MFHVTQKNQRWWILAALTGAFSMVFLDQTILPVALPSIQQELGATDTQVNWFINAYLLAFTVFLLPSGKLSDIFGGNKIYLAGVAIFALSSVFCGFATHPLELIVFRVSQGLGGALITPAAISMVTQIFPVNEQGKATGIQIGFGSIFLSLGPFLGGLLSETLSWRYIFFINVPVAIFTIILFSLVFNAKSFQLLTHQRKFDFAGFFTLAPGIIAFVTAIMQGSHWGWLSFNFLVLLFTGLFFFAAFIFIERQTASPLVSSKLVQNKAVLLCCLITILAQPFLILPIFWAIFCQKVLGYSPLEAGLLILPAVIPQLIIAPLGGKYIDKIGSKISMILALGVMITGVTLSLGILFYSKYVFLLPGLIGVGLASTMTTIPLRLLVQQSVSKRLFGSASGLLTLFRQLGTTLSIAILGSIIIQFGPKGYALASILAIFLGVIALFLSWKYLPARGRKFNKRMRSVLGE